MKIKFRALLTICGDLIENGEMVIDEGNIVEIGTTQSGNADTDLSDCLLMPGFVNMYSHLSLTTLNKKLSPPDSFVGWIRELIPLNADLDEKSRIRGICEGAEEMRRSGVTALGDYVAKPELLPVIGGLGFRSVLFLEVIEFKSEKVQALYKKLEELLKFACTSPLYQLGLAPHASYSVSPRLFQSLSQLAQQYHCPLSSHVAETQEESGFLMGGDNSLERLLKERSAWDFKWQSPYKTPIQYLSSLGVLDRLIAIHCNFISEDLDIMDKKKVNAVFCPQSTDWFGRTQFMPVRALLDRGVTVALGTDSLASNNSLNFLDELRMADKLLPDVSRKEIITMATRGGAEALGLKCGVLAPGKKADLIGFRVSKTYAGPWWDVPFESHRRKVDFYSVDENYYGFC